MLCLKILKKEVIIMINFSKRYEEDMIIRMAHHSSAIEGNSITLSDTITILTEGKTVEGYEIREFFEIYNHKEAFIELMYKLNNNETLSNSLMKDIHEKLTDNILVYPGRFKENDNYIKGSDVKTVDPRLAEMTMHQWCENLNFQLEIAGDKREKVKQILKSHVEFERYHPFEDGNGRTGRMLMIYSLMQNDIAPLVIQKEDKNIYKNFLESLSPYNKEYNENLEKFTDYAMEKIEQEQKRMDDIDKSEKQYVSLDDLIKKEEEKRKLAINKRRVRKFEFDR